MAKEKHQSATPASDWLKAHKVTFETFSYDYIEHGGTAVVADVLGVDHHSVVKTLIMEDEHAKPLVILMHGDCEVSTKNLARQVGVKHIAPCKMPVFVQQSILDLDAIYINGGRRGFIVKIAPSVLTEHLGAKPVDCAIAQ